MLTSSSKTITVEVKECLRCGEPQTTPGSEEMNAAPVGSKFGRLTVLKKAESRNRKMYVVCSDEYRKLRVPTQRKFRKSQVHPQNVRHQASSLMEKVKGRSSTNAVGNPGYKDYRGRGITLCQEWYMIWALSNGYCESNCRWVSRAVNCNNKRKRTDNTSGFIGVTTQNGGRSWIARCRSTLGGFRTAERDLHVIKHGGHLNHGILLNFPELGQP